MKNENTSRREALKILGKTGLFVGTAPVFFASIKITPLDETATVPDSAGTPPARIAVLQEKALISGSGSSLSVKVSGKPGRVFFVTFAAADVRDNYRRIPGSDGVIGPNGTGDLALDIRNIPLSRVFLKIITGEPNNLKSNMAATEPLVLTLKKGALLAFEGTVSRPLLDTKLEPTQVLIAMAATRENSIQLR